MLKRGERSSRSGFARQAVIAKPASRSKSKRIAAICLGATLSLGIFFARRSQKHKIDSTAAGAEDHSVIVHVATAYQGDMGVLLDHDRGVLKQAEIDLARYREALTSHAVAKQILDDQEQAVVQDQGAVKFDLGQVQYAEASLATVTSQLQLQAGLVCDWWIPAIRFLRAVQARSL